MKKPRSTVFMLLWATLGLLVAALLMVLGGARVFALLVGPRDYGALAPGELEGAYVRIEIDTVLDEYAFTENGSGGVVSREYAVATPDGRQYLGLQLPGSQLDSVGRQLESLAFERYPLVAQVTVEGTLRSMDEETKVLFDEALDYYAVDDGMACYYLLYVGEVGSLSAGLIGLMFGCACLLAAVSLALLIVTIVRRRRE